MNGPDDQVLVTEIRDAYASSADAWGVGPARIYRRLAAALVGSATDDLAGRQVLDLGAGTGVVSEALREVDARPVGLDLAVEMLAHGQGSRPPGVAGDAQRLPFRDATFDAVVAAFSLNHVPDLAAVLASCRRVLVGRGLLLASTFPNGFEHPAKPIVERVLERFGYERPRWYATLRSRVADVTGDPDRLERAAREAGLTAVRAEPIPVEVGLDDPRLAVEWRLNMPHTLAFVTSLDPGTREDLRRAATRDLTGSLPSALPMLVLHGRSPEA